MNQKTFDIADGDADTVDAEFHEQPAVPAADANGVIHEPTAPVTAITIVDPDRDPTGLMHHNLTERQVDFLLQRTPKREIKWKKGRGGTQQRYVPWQYVTNQLNAVFGFNWDLAVVDKQIIEDEIIVECVLTVRFPNGETVSKTQFGGSEIKRHTSGASSGKPVSIADDYKGAVSDALKKCAALLGIGLDVMGAENAADNPSSDELKRHINAVLKQRGMVDREVRRQFMDNLTGGVDFATLPYDDQMRIVFAVEAPLPAARRKY